MSEDKHHPTPKKWLRTSTVSSTSDKEIQLALRWQQLGSGYDNLHLLATLENARDLAEKLNKALEAFDSADE